MRLDVLKSVLCDDVRVEHNGKYLLIGVYTANAIGAPPPIKEVSFSCYIEAISDRSEILSGDFRIQDANGKTIQSGPIRFQCADHPFVVYIAHLIVPIREAGMLDLQWRVAETDWKSITPIFVGLRSDSSKPKPLPLDH